MPAVTVELSPSGEPKATTGSPTLRASDAPSDGSRQVRPVLDEQHGEVVRRTTADDRGFVLVAVLVDHLDGAVVLGRVGHDVVVGDEVALAVEHEAGAGRAGLLALVLRQDLHGAGQHLPGHGGHGAVARAAAGRRSALALLQPVGHAAVAVGLGGPALVHRPAQRPGRRADDEGERADGRPHPTRDPAALLAVALRRGGVRRHRLGAGRRVRRPGVPLRFLRGRRRRPEGSAVAALPRRRGLRGRRYPRCVGGASGGPKAEREERGTPVSGAVSSWSEGCSGRSLTQTSSQRAASATPRRGVGRRGSAGATGERRDDGAREGRGVRARDVGDGARRSMAGALAGAAPRASTPRTAAPAAPPPMATRLPRRGLAASASSASPGVSPACAPISASLRRSDAGVPPSCSPARRVFTQPSRSTRSRQ